MISHSLERILKEHKDIKDSQETLLQIDSIRSIRNLAKNWDIVQSIQHFDIILETWLYL